MNKTVVTNTDASNYFSTTPDLPLSTVPVSHETRLSLFSILTSFTQLPTESTKDNQSLGANTLTSSHTAPDALSESHQTLADDSSTSDSSLQQISFPQSIWLVTTDPSENHSDNSILVRQFQPDPSWNVVLVATGIVCVALVVVNLCLLVASKFTSGGRTPILIFVRSLCVADTMSGTFGLMKMSQVLMRWHWINCFLPESLLFSSIIAFNLTSVMLSATCHSMLSDFVKFDRRQDKHRSIFSMTFLWNSAFVVGFMPHMGWNLNDRMGWNSEGHTCVFLLYYSKIYLAFVTSIVGVCLVITLVLQTRIQTLLQRSVVNKHLILKMTIPITKTTRMDCVSMFLCYLPPVVYLLLTCESCVLSVSTAVANATLVLFVPLVILRSVLTTLLHQSRTTQIGQVVDYFKKSCWSMTKKSLGLGHSQALPSIQVAVIESPSNPHPAPSTSETTPKSVPSGNGELNSLQLKPTVNNQYCIHCFNKINSKKALQIRAFQEQGLHGGLTGGSPVQHYKSSSITLASQATSNVTLATNLGSDSGLSGDPGEESNNGILLEQTLNNQSNQSLENQLSDLNWEDSSNTSAAGADNFFMRPQQDDPYWSGTMPHRQNTLGYRPSFSAEGNVESPEFQGVKTPIPSARPIPPRSLLWQQLPTVSEISVEKQLISDHMSMERKENGTTVNTKQLSLTQVPPSFDSEVVVHTEQR